MGYGLGVDLGTTFTAAAVDRDGHVDMVPLGDRSAAVPSVVLIREDGTALTGDAADRRSASDPDRVAREVKRRLGDPTPLVLGGSPYSPADLMARHLADVVRLVTEREGGRPERVTLTHPANWGPYKRELFGQIPRQAGLEQVRMITEPEAAAAHYAANERLAEGALVAVYDLGGGTFDATVLRTVPGGFRILGVPEGVENLGGVDFDEAVVAHVDRAVDGAISALDPSDPRATAAMVRLRAECVLAKEALSADTETAIPVMLPELQTEVRLTRSEFESMVAPSVGATIAALRRGLDSAEVDPDQLDAVLLVGGSSRIPMVSRMVSAELGRPTAVDAHPKHAIVLGAALLSRPATDRGASPASGPVPRTGAPVAGPASGLVPRAVVPTPPPGAGPPRRGTMPAGPGGPTGPGGPASPAGPAASEGPDGPRPTPAAGMPAPPLAAPDDGGPGSADSRPRRRLPVAAAALVGLLLLGGGGTWAYTALSGSSPVESGDAVPVAPAVVGPAPDESAPVVSAEPAPTSAAGGAPTSAAPTRRQTTTPPPPTTTRTTTRTENDRTARSDTTDDGAASDSGTTGGGTGGDSSGGSG